MERTLYTERLYSLGDFKNIKFSNALSGIPEELASNDKVVGLLFFQQALACEIAYRRYYNTIQKITEEKIHDVLGYLEEQRNQTMQELYEEINKAESKASNKLTVLNEKMPSISKVSEAIENDPEKGE